MMKLTQAITEDGMGTQLTSHKLKNNMTAFLAASIADATKTHG